MTREKRAEMRKILYAVFFVFTVTACANPQTNTQTTEPAFTLVPTLVVDDALEEEVELPPYFPQFGDSELTKGNAIVSSVYVIFSGTDPNQVLVHISGYLPTPCHELRVTVPDPDAEGDIYMEVYSLTPPDQICEQVLRAYDVSVNLGTYPTGSYWVWLNGGRAGNFDF